MLGLEQAGSHAVEGTGKLGDFVPPGRIYRMVEVAAFQGANPRHQASQRPRERVGDKKHQCASDQDRCQAKQHEEAVELVKEPRGLIIRSQNSETDRDGLLA